MSKQEENFDDITKTIMEELGSSIKDDNKKELKSKVKTRVEQIISLKKAIRELKKDISAQIDDFKNNHKELLEVLDEEI